MKEVSVGPLVLQAWLGKSEPSARERDASEDQGFMDTVSSFSEGTSGIASFVMPALRVSRHRLLEERIGISVSWSNLVNATEVWKGRITHFEEPNCREWQQASLTTLFRMWFIRSSEAHSFLLPAITGCCRTSIRLGRLFI